MFICPVCFKKEVQWSDGSSKYCWCDNCVPRGCSCNEEYFFNVSPKKVAEGDFDYSEQISNLIKQVFLLPPSSYDLFFSKVGVSQNKQTQEFTLELNHTDYHLISLSVLTDKTFLKNLFENKNSSIKIVYKDTNGNLLPCCEILFLNDTFKKEVGEKFFSLKHNSFVFISEIYENGSFKSILDEDYANPIYYSKKGFNYKDREIDLLISEFEYNDIEFKFLNNLIFNTQNSEYIIKVSELFGDNKLFFEYNDDIEFFYLYRNETLRTPLQLDINNKIFNLLNSDIKKYFHLSDEKIDKLHFLIEDFHRINQVVKYASNYSKDNIIKRKKLFIEIFKIFYFNSKD